MSTTMVLGVLSLGTMGAVALFAYLGSVRTADRLHQERRKSTLAADAPSRAADGETRVD